MNKNKILGGLLALQVVAAILFLLGNNRLQEHAGIEKLLEFDRDGLDAINISDADGNSVELILEQGNWVTSENFPVDAGRVNRLLDELAGLNHGLAVANSANAAKRFKVDKDAYERHIRLLQQGKPVSDFYLGSGAGARRNHIRLADEDAIYAATLATYSVPAEIGDWQDKEQLKLDVDQIHTVLVDGLAISRQPAGPEATDAAQPAATATGWMTDSLAAGESLDLETFQNQLNSLADVLYNKAFKGSLEEAVADTAAPVREISVSYADKSRTYQFYNAKEDDLYVLKVSDRDELFEVSSYTGNQITENLSAVKLIQKPEPVSGEDSPDGVSTGSTTTNDTENALPAIPGS